MLRQAQHDKVEKLSMTAATCHPEPVEGSSAQIPPVARACRMTVAIPAKNEEALLVRALAAFARQRDERGARVDPGAFEVIVYCNDCDDATAARARRFARDARDLAIHVIEARLPARAAHVGTARRNALELAVRRYAAAGRPDGIVASTDADSVVSEYWVSAMLREMRGVDAVAGSVSIEAHERDAMMASQRVLYDRELVYRRLIGLAEARFDPRPYDPPPRHDTFVGANFATTAWAYRRAGGLPALPQLEDLAFSQALARVDARVRHTYDAPVTTSARSIARVDGGFGTFLGGLSALGERGDAYLVRPARGIIEDATARALSRAFRRGDLCDERLEELVDLVAQPEAALRAAAAEARTFGAFWETVRSRAPQRNYPLEPVQAAIRALRLESAAWSPRVPTRSNVASGAG
jgi:hypothetical protein